MAVFPTMQKRYVRVAARFWPALSQMPAERQALGAAEVILFLAYAPIALIGVIWLANSSSLDSVLSNLPLLALIAILVIVLGQLKYVLATRIQDASLGSSEGSLAGVAIVSGVFLFGPVVLWISVLSAVISLLIGWDRAVGASTRWRLLRQGTMSVAGSTVAPLFALAFYWSLGGTIPISGLEARALMLAIAALVLDLLIQASLASLYIGYHTWIRGEWTRLRNTLAFALLVLAVPNLANPFGALAAGIFVENGLPAYLFFWTGLLLVAILARRWSLAAETSRQQSEALVELEGLGHDIITSTPDPDRLPRLLAEHLPGMFPSSKLVLWRLPDQVLFKQPGDWNANLDQIWPWLAGQSESQYFLAGDSLPWDSDQPRDNPILITPILEKAQSIGAIYLSLHSELPWDRNSVEQLVPATQSLAALIGSAFNQSDAYAADLRLERLSQELESAGEIQSSLIPFEIPRVRGWRISVTLNPVEETSGDFFDLIPLPDGKLGVVIADVVDKGVGAALYMALSRTLLRTYAIEADSDPELVFFATNARMLADTTSNLFVTAFYGVLDSESGHFDYCNAGHNPPYVVRPGEPVIIQELIRTGIPIGVQEGATWTRASVQLQPGDRLLLYTDGIPDAHNGDGEYLTTGPMLDIAKENIDLSAEDLQVRILQEITNFVGDAPQSDDITLMILARDRSD